MTSKIMRAAEGHADTNAMTSKMLINFILVPVLGLATVGGAVGYGIELAAESTDGYDTLAIENLITTITGAYIGAAVGGVWVATNIVGWAHHAIRHAYFTGAHDNADGDHDYK